jgi:hypothetical protein
MASRQTVLNLKEPESARVWIVSFNAHARAKEWTDDDKKRKITDNFMSRCGLDALEKLISIVQPRKLEEMKFAEIEVAITKYLAPEKRLVIAERTNFFNTRQIQCEKINDYLARLRESARHCEFDDFKNSA